MAELNPDQQAAKEALDKKMAEVFKLEFSGKDLMFILTVLTKIQFVYGDFLNAQPIIEKIEPLFKEEVTDSIVK